MEKNSNDQDTFIGFLALHETMAHDGYLGAILVTDLHGIPQEFRCTHPVKPTPVQKPLYGDTLQPYIGVNLCGIPLTESIKNKPALIIVRDEFLLNVRTETPCPVVFLRRAGEAIDVTTADDSAIALKRVRIECSTGKFQPIVIASHPSFDEDVAATRVTIDRIFSSFDPIEPFERIEKAIEILAKQDSKYQ